ncbi:hypothetical protein FSP39_024037 [Pinctada imbricata]|uniref:ATP-dependent DNA helicase n=1 Tax=Pinctada imbricata TaxID=66713 RepID=A0AA88Y1G0_PINIB|nr:hypothetical protein FSP39_024037 [Pinctada imbricata]
MASLQLGVGATTIHHWAGIVDGRYSHQTLAELFQGDDRFADAKKRIIEAQCLVIDEISILSSRTFDMVEFVCRHVRECDQVFGGMQVLRQSESPLIKAVHELCDGRPSEETIQFLRSLDRPLNASPEDIMRLYGTNFDACVVNQDMLEQMNGEMFSFKAKDKGDIRKLLGCVAPKTLLLKEGAKVILIKNIAAGLFNGMTGIVHRLERGSPPVINFNGRAVSTSGLRVVNFNPKAASAKHPDFVYEFYEKDFSAFRDDLLCCKQSSLEMQSDICKDQNIEEEIYPSNMQSDTRKDQNIEEDSPGPSKQSKTFEFPQLEAPWSFDDFVSELGHAPYIVNLPKELITSTLMSQHISFLYFKIKGIMNDQPKSPQQWTQSFTKLNNFVLT